MAHGVRVAHGSLLWHARRVWLAKAFVAFLRIRPTLPITPRLHYVGCFERRIESHVYATYLRMKRRSSDERPYTIQFHDRGILLWLDRCHVVCLVFCLLVECHIGAVGHRGFPAM